MTEKAADIVKDALSEITAYGAEASVEQVDANLAVRYMNRMMAAFDVEGIDLGYTKVTNLGDDVTIPDGAIEAVVFNLSARLWRSFADDAPVPPDLILKATQGVRTLEMLAVTIAPSRFPGTLPIGSGNYTGYTLGDNYFYPESNADILAETNGSISLEDNTE